MVSPYKLIGMLLQVAGMGVMVFGFLTLVGGLQQTVGHVTESMMASSGVLPSSQPQKCDNKTDPLCGVDINKEGALESVFSQKVYTFIFWLGAGIVLLFMGLLLRSSEEVGGFFSSLPERSKLKQRMQVGKPGFGGGGYYPPPA